MDYMAAHSDNLFLWVQDANSTYREISASTMQTVFRLNTVLGLESRQRARIRNTVSILSKCPGHPLSHPLLCKYAMF